MTKSPIMASLRLEFDSVPAATEWIGADKVKPWTRPPMRAVSGLTIDTAEGPRIAEYGSWIVQRRCGAFDVLSSCEFSIELRA